MPLQEVTVIPHSNCERLQFADDLFIRRHRGLGSPAINQWVWRFDTAPNVSAVSTLDSRLSEGALARRVDSALVPGARDRWSRASDGIPVDISTTPIPLDSITSWMAGRVALPLDVESGRSWRLSSTPLLGGGGLVSLVAAHAVADGGAMLDALVRANTDRPALTPPTTPALLPALVGDASDSIGQFAEVARWAASKLRAVIEPTPAAATSPTPQPPVDGPVVAEPHSMTAGNWRTPYTIVEFPTAELLDAAADHGGSANTLFAAALARMVRATGRFAGDGDIVPVALPVSGRTADDPRSNATKIAVARIPATDLTRQDLSVIKVACKEAYGRLAASTPAAAPIPLALVQMLPDKVIGLLPQPPGAAVLASNLGSLPPEFTTIGGVTARSISALAHYYGADADEVRTIGNGVAGFLAIGETYSTVSVSGLDPVRIPDVNTLRSLVIDELSAWGITGSSW